MMLHHCWHCDYRRSSYQLRLFFPLFIVLAIVLGLRTGTGEALFVTFLQAKTAMTARA